MSLKCQTVQDNNILRKMRLNTVISRYCGHGPVFRIDPVNRKQARPTQSLNGGIWAQAWWDSTICSPSGICFRPSCFPPLTARQAEVRHLGDVAGPVVHEDYVREFEVAEDDPVVVAVPRARDDICQAAGWNRTERGACGGKQ